MFNEVQIFFFYLYTINCITTTKVHCLNNLFFSFYEYQFALADALTEVWYMRLCKINSCSKIRIYSLSIEKQKVTNAAVKVKKMNLLGLGLFLAF